MPKRSERPPEKLTPLAAKPRGAFFVGADCRQ
jgi:hypothetical protein